MAASRFSVPVQQRPITDVVGLEMLDSTLGYKQHKLEEGFALVTNTVEQVNALDLVRDQDIARRDQLLSAQVAELNANGQDFSNPINVMKLQSKVKAITADKELMKGLANTRNYRQLVSRYDQLKSDPKKRADYSAVNEQMDMETASSWLRGETDVMAINSPTIYTPIEKLGQDMMKTMKPKVFSKIDGLHNVENTLLTDRDLKTSLMGQVAGNVDMQRQLSINARAAFSGKPDSEVYNQAIEYRRQDIAQAKEDLQRYKVASTDPSITPEQRNDMTAKIQTMSKSVLESEGALKELETKHLSGNYNGEESAQLKNELYIGKWTDGMVRPYVIDKTSIKTDNGAVFAQRRQDDLAKLQATMDQRDRHFNLDLQDKINARKEQSEQYYAKLGQSLSGEDYYGDGKNLPAGDTRVGAGFAPGRFNSLPAVAPEKDYPALADITTKVEQLRSENRNLMTDAIIKGVSKTDPTLAGELNSLFKDGKGQFKNYKGTSQMAISMLNKWDDLLMQAVNPANATNVGALRSYGAVANQIGLNMMKMNSLNGLTDEATTKVYNEAIKSKEFTGSIEDFKKAVNGELKSPKVEMTVGASNGIILRGGQTSSYSKFSKQINETLNASPRNIEFVTTRVIAPGDKVFNGPNSEANTNIYQTIMDGTGVVIDGANYSINNARGENKVYRDDLGPVSGITINRIVPTKNEVHVTLQQTDAEGKKTGVGRNAIVQLNAEQMQSITGISSNKQSIGIYDHLKNGVMVDQNKKPIYMNLAADVPEMMGNIKYRFYDARDGQRGMKMSVLFPDKGGKLGEVHLDNTIFRGEDAHLKGGQALAIAYREAFQAEKMKTPAASDKEIYQRAMTFLIQELRNK